MTTGPLSGVKVLEIAGIGPGPSAECCSRIWAPMWCVSIARVAGACNWCRGPTTCSTAENVRCRRSRDIRRRRDGAVIGRARRHPVRGIPPRGGRTSRVWTRTLPAAATPIGLRTHDRMGSRRPDRAHRRTRHHLHRTHRSAARDRASRWPPQIPLNLARRLRRRQPRTCWSACSPHSTRPDEAVVARWSTPRSSMAPPI